MNKVVRPFRRSNIAGRTLGTTSSYAFDLLHVDGVDLIGQPLLTRRKRLPEVLEGSGLLLSKELPGTPARSLKQFAIGGYRPGSNGITALLVGYYDETGLRFAGKVRAGFVPHLRRGSRQGAQTAPHHAVPLCRSAELEVVPLGWRRDG